MNTEYTSGYSVSSPQIRWFWDVVSAFSEEEKAQLVMFFSGSSKVPLGGFANLQGMRGLQKFNVGRAAGTTSLPAAHTCFNTIDLPEYENAEVLRDKLLMAISETQGFGFA